MVPPLHRPQVQLEVQIWVPVPQAPQVMLSPGAQAPSPEQVAGQPQVASQVTVPQFPQPATVPGAQAPWPVHVAGSVGQ